MMSIVHGPKWPFYSCLDYIALFGTGICRFCIWAGARGASGRQIGCANAAGACGARGRQAGASRACATGAHERGADVRPVRTWACWLGCGLCTWCTQPVFHPVSTQYCF